MGFCSDSLRDFPKENFYHRLLKFQLKVILEFALIKSRAAAGTGSLRCRFCPNASERRLAEPTNGTRTSASCSCHNNS